MKYVLVAIYALLVILLQLSFWEIVGSENRHLEFSLLLVIYAGLRMNPVLGGVLSYLLGYFFDALAGGVPGLYGLIYVLIFSASLFASRATAVSSSPFIMLLVFFVVLCKEFLVLAYLILVNDPVIWGDMWLMLLLQAAILALLSPSFFRLFARCEVILSRERQR